MFIGQIKKNYINFDKRKAKSAKWKRNISIALSGAAVAGGAALAIKKGRKPKKINSIFKIDGLLDENGFATMTGLDPKKTHLKVAKSLVKKKQKKKNTKRVKDRREAIYKSLPKEGMINRRDFLEATSKDKENPQIRKMAADMISSHVKSLRSKGNYFSKETVNFGRGPDKKPRKRRGEGEPSRVSHALNTAGKAGKYAASLKVGSEIWNAGNKLGTGAARNVGKSAARLASKNKTTKRVAKVIGKRLKTSGAGKGAVALAGLAGGDQLVKALGRATASHKIRREKRKNNV